jgi:SulP family sulfate permease
MLELEDLMAGGNHGFDEEVAEVTLGRQAGCTIRLASPSVSKQHARLYRDGGVWLLEDSHSTNGTWLNDKPVSRLPIRRGDRIAFGSYELRVVHADDEARTEHGPSFETSSEQTLLRSFALGSPSYTLPSFRRSRRGHRGSARARLSSWLPPLGWLKGYGATDVRNDLIAGATTAALLVPQGMAYAALAGLPPVVGLYASVLPMLLYAAFGTCRQLSVGPVALDSLLVASIVGSISASGSPDYVGAAALLALMTGAIQLGLGLLRAGFLVNFLSSPVICGFTAAAALLTAVSQLDTLLGLTLPRSASFFSDLRLLAEHIDGIHWLTVSVAALSILLLLGAKRFKASWLPLFLLILATVLTSGLELDEKGLETVGEVPRGLPSLALPAIDFDLLGALLPGALTLALIGFMQTISIGKAMSARRRYLLDADQEMRALGLANLGAGLSEGYTVTGGLSRSSVNADAGAHTQLASVVTAFLIVCALLWATPLLRDLPTVVLAAVIVISILGLIDRAEVERIFRVRKSEGGLLVLTFASTLLLGIQLGVLVGVAASILLFIVRNTSPNAAILGRIPGTDVYRSLRNHPDGEVVPGIVILRIDASFYFANCEFIRSELREILSFERPDAIVLESGAINDLDSSADAALHEIADELEKDDVRLYIANVKEPVRAVMKRSGLYDRVGADHFFFTIGAAVERAVSERAGSRAAAR